HNLSFEHESQNGNPRLETDAFHTAAGWLASLAARKCFASDPAANLMNGKAMLGILSLAQLAKLRSPSGEVSPRYGIAALPGTRSYPDGKTGHLIRGTGSNYIPYFSGGKLAVVRNRCTRPEAAFDLIADLGGPTRSAELISNPELGVGPFRSTHLEQDRLLLWLGYGLDSDRSKQLQAALHQNIRSEVRNAVYPLRAPDQKELDAAAAFELAKIAAGAVPGDVGLRQLREAWEQIDQKTPAATRLQWRRLSAGTN
ncbi:MAG TPA: hypothetical protein VLM40_05815, partial [Gemmata sp.]|nr:hypothetical protein [Gemmata sp.]